MYVVCVIVSHKKLLYALDAFMKTLYYCVKNIGSRVARDITETEDCRVQRMAMAHCTSSAAEIRAADGITYLTFLIFN